MKIEVDFSVGDKVVITKYGVEGFVNGLYCNLLGWQYDIEYKDANNAIFSRYFTKDEIKLNSKNI